MKETLRSEVIRFGVFEVRAEELRKNGLKLRLRGQPFQILAMLLEHPGEAVTRATGKFGGFGSMTERQCKLQEGVDGRH